MFPCHSDKEPFHVVPAMSDPHMTRIWRLRAIALGGGLVFLVAPLLVLRPLVGGTATAGSERPLPRPPPCAGSNAAWKGLSVFGPH